MSAAARAASDRTSGLTARTVVTPPDPLGGWLGEGEGADGAGAHAPATVTISTSQRSGRLNAKASQRSRRRKRACGSGLGLWIRGEPRVDLRAEARRRLCERLETSGRAERVLAVVHLDREPILARV